MLAALSEHRALFAQLDSLAPQLRHAAWFISGNLQRGGKLLLAGNGGSASDCQHIAAEFVGRFKHERKPIPAMSLTADTSNLTALGNDYGFDHIYARQVRAFGKQGDTLIVISTSGNSPNIIEALHAARDQSMTTIGLFGMAGKAAALCNVPIQVPSHCTARVQEAHIFLGHCLVEEVEALLQD